MGFAMSIHRKCHVVPPYEQRCVWMAAGILSYQLCDRMLECDGCLLDQAIRRRFLTAHPGSEREQPGSPEPETLEPLRAEFMYSPNHCWVRERNDRILLVGIEPGLGSVLLTPKAIVFPSVGQALHAGQTCLWIVMEGGTLPLECPVDGRVVTVNTALEQNPHLLHQGPFDQAWLYELKPESPILEDPRLMDATEACKKYSADQNRFTAMLSAAMHGHRRTVGTGLPDADRRQQNIADRLGPGRYFSVIRQVFG
jgi:glycine cleavage system H protein